MVVVEGVARSLDPRMNIWDVARPIVEDYIKESIGPKALLRDLAHTVQVVSRFGPKLPQLAEELLVRQSNPPPAARKPDWTTPLLWASVGAASATAVIWLGTVL